MTDRVEEHLSAAAIGRYASMAYAVSPWMPSSGPASSVDSDTFTGVIPLMIESMPNVNRNAHADAKLTAPHCTRKNRVPPRSNPSTPPDAAPKGSVADEAFEALAGELVRRLQAAPRFDGVLLSLHGAMVVESYPSGDAEIVRRVREVVGPDLPVVVSHDFHANVTPEIVAQSTALVSYQENPHIDTKARGVRAARIVAETVRGAAKPVQALVKPPMLYNIVLPASTHELRRLPGASAHPRGQGRRSAPRGIRADGGPHHRGRHGWSDGGEPCQAHLHARSPASVWSRRVRAGKRARRNSAAAHSEVAGTPPASVAAQRAESPASGVLEEFKGGHRPGGLGNI